MLFFPLFIDEKMALTKTHIAEKLENVRFELSSEADVLTNGFGDYVERNNNIVISTDITPTASQLHLSEFNQLITKTKYENFLNTMNMLNVLRKNRQLCDVLIHIDDKHNDLYCHQLILACNSKLFMELFLNIEIDNSSDRQLNTSEKEQLEMKPYQHNVQLLHDKYFTYNNSSKMIIIDLESYLKRTNYKHNELTYEALKLCINYMYTNELNLNKLEVKFNNLIKKSTVPTSSTSSESASMINLIKELYCLSIQLMFDNLVRACSKYLIENLDETNCLYIRSFALDEQLIQNSTEYIVKSFTKILYLNEFLNLPRINIELIGLKSKLILINNEVNYDLLNNLVLKWLVQQFTSSAPSSRSVSPSSSPTSPKTNALTANNPAIVTNGSKSPPFFMISNGEYEEILNNLSENINILYLNDDKSLHDCLDMDQTNKNYCDYINDYQKKAQHNHYHHHHHHYNTQNSIEHNTNHSNYNQNLFKNEIIYTFQTNGNNFISLSIINGRLLTLSIHLQQIDNSQNNEDLKENLQEQRIRSSSVVNSCETLTINEGFNMLTVSVNNDGTNNVRSLTPTPNSNSVDIKQQSEVMLSTASLEDLQSLSRSSSLSNNSHYKLAKMVSPRCTHGLVAYNKQLLVIGGYDRGECLSKCEVYNPIENKLTNFEPLTQRRGRAATLYFSKLDTIYCFGGSDGHNELYSMEKYDFKLNKWNLVQFDVLFDCTNIGVTCDDESIYLVGIHDNKTNMPIHCLKYDPLANTFKCISDLNSGK